MLEEKTTDFDNLLTVEIRQMCDGKPRLRFFEKISSISYFRMVDIPADFSMFCEWEAGYAA